MIQDVALTKPCRRVGRPRARARLPIVGLLGFAALDAHGQAGTDAAPAKVFSVVPSVSVSETLTDNAGLSATDKQADLISEISPTLRMRSAAGRVQGFLDYALSGLVYARGTDANSIQQSLNAAVQAQAIDDRLFVNAGANISRQNVSALGVQTPDTSLKTSNQTQVESFNLDPYLRGRFGKAAGYRLGLDYSATHTGSSAIGDSTNAGESFHLGSDEPVARANWALDLSREVTDFSLGRTTTTRSAVGSLVFTPDIELQFTIRGGREGNDIETAGMKGSPTYGGGLRWTPSERTTLSVQDDRHFFGNSYAVTFQHRSPQTVWTLSDTRGATTDASAAAQGQLMTAFDLVYLQLASKYPDPITRASQALLELQTLGINPLSVVSSGFLTDAASVQRTLSASFAYLGLRTDVLVSAQQGDSSRLDTLSPAVDSLAAGNPIRQRSLSLSASHRLTPQSSVNLTLAGTRSVDKITGSRLDLRTVSINWTSQVGLRTQVSLGARHAVSTGEAVYDESAVLASITLQF